MFHRCPAERADWFHRGWCEGPAAQRIGTAEKVLGSSKSPASKVKPQGLGDLGFLGKAPGLVLEGIDDFIYHRGSLLAELQVRAMGDSDQGMSPAPPTGPQIQEAPRCTEMGFRRESFHLGVLGIDFDPSLPQLCVVYH